MVRYLFVASVPLLQAAFTAGRSETVSYHFCCTAGCVTYCTNFQAAARLGLFLKTTISAPPANEVFVISLGSVVIAHLPFIAAPPSCWIRLISHGPEMNIGVDPLTKPCATSKFGGSVMGVRPCLKNCW